MLEKFCKYCSFTMGCMYILMPLTSLDIIKCQYIQKIGPIVFSDQGMFSVLNRLKTSALSQSG